MGVHTSDNNCGCGDTGSGSNPGNEFLQNNVGRKLNAGIFTIQPVASNMYDYAVAEKVAERFNSIALTITEIETPVIVYVIIFVAGGLSSKRHKLQFLKGRGNYGLGGTPVIGTDFEIFTTQNLLISDVTDDNAYTVTIDLGNLPDGDYLTAANGAERDFIDATKTYFITYNKDGKAYLLKFEGELGYYGGSYPDEFIMENFLPASDSDVQPDITFTSQLINNGDGTSPFATEGKLNSFSLIVNQATANLYLRNYEGVNVAAVNLAFLNNEGTTFFYEENTQMLQLKNDAGEILSSVPVSAFVANLMRTVDFNAVTPHLLEFKDSTGNVVDSVTVTINNVQGLQAALNNKVNKDGSNAVPYTNWPINVLGAATAEQFGDAYGDFLNDGTVQTHAVGYDSAQNKVKRYTALSFRTWLAIAMTDVSGLVTALANITTALSGKANLNGGNNFRGIQSIGNAIETPNERKVLEFNVGGYGSPGGFLQDSNGDKIILYRGSDYEAVIGVGGSGNVTFKSYSTSGGGGYDYYTSSTTGNIQLAMQITGNGKVKVYNPPTEANDVLRLQDIGSKADLVAGKVPASQLPSFVDDVLEYASLAAFPATGESGKIYVTLDTNLTYRWSGSAYVEISKSIALGETAATAGRGDRTKAAYDHSNTMGNPHNTQIGDIPDLAETIDGILAGQAYTVDTSYTGSSGWFSTLNSRYPGAAPDYKVIAVAPDGTTVLCVKLADGQWMILTGVSGIVPGS